MRAALHPHPAAPAPAVQIEAVVARPSAHLIELRCRVSGNIAAIELPELSPPRRVDGLWRHTCFELFLRAPAEAGYLEYNFAPSGEWAAYRFSDYRAGMAPIEDGAPAIESRIRGGRYALTATFDLEPALGLLADLPWQFALAAVIETRDGRKSYWAAAHPPGAPDFHHRDCFALKLPPPKRG
jgi:hypothetical protein